MFTINRNLAAVALAAGICIAALLGPGQAAAADKEYKIQFTRVEKVGQKYQLDSKGSHAQEVLMGGAAVQKQDMKFVVKGVREVLKVDANGQATEVSFTIETCDKVEGETSTALASKGTVVIISSVNGKKVTKAKDDAMPLSDEAMLVVDRVVDVQTAEGSGDQAFGSEKPRKVGESWPVNSKFIAETFSKMLGKDGALKVEDVTGQAKLLSTSTVGGTPCVRLRVGMKIKNFAPPMPGAMSVDKGELTIELEGDFPIDVTLPMLAGVQHMTSAVAISGTGPNGEQIKMEVNSDDKVDEKKTVLNN